jgi:hypothetical protein
MGECGCSEFNALFKFKGPKGITYVVDIYPSCPECCAPAGVIIYAFSKQDMADWGCEDVPTLPIEYEGTCISVIHPETLKEEMLKISNEDDLAGVSSGVLFEDTIRDSFREAVFRQINFVNKQLKQIKKG